MIELRGSELDCGAHGWAVRVEKKPLFASAPTAIDGERRRPI
jgi:hypothetical protein